MDSVKKRNIGIISFLPMLAFIIAIGYNILTVSDLISTRTLQNHIGVATDMSHNYPTLFILYAIAAIVSTAVLLYFVVHIARIKNMNPAIKIGWIIVLVSFVPISFPLFYFIQVRHEPKYLETYPDIA